MMWNLPPPSGFQGFRDDLPLLVYHQVLPHWRQDGATYFVTFRLNDSLPQSKLQELAAFKTEWERRHPRPRDKSTLDELSREVMRRVEHWLDQGMGCCCLKSPDVSQVVADEIHDIAEAECEVGCFAIMPNHVHAVLRPLMPAKIPLETILKRWKGRSAHSINQLRNLSETLWQRDSFDRIIRDVEHLWRVVQYIGSNPRRANLLAGASRVWIHPSWVESGWKFENS